MYYEVMKMEYVTTTKMKTQRQAPYGHGSATLEQEPYIYAMEPHAKTSTNR
jgi:hypothetical protein